MSSGEWTEVTARLLGYKFKQEKSGFVYSIVTPDGRNIGGYWGLTFAFRVIAMDMKAKYGISYWGSNTSHTLGSVG